MKKGIATLLTILIILNLYTPHVNAATDDEGGPRISDEALNATMYEGEGIIPTKQGNEVGTQREATDASSKTNAMDTVIGIVLSLFTIPPKIASWVMSEIVLHGKINYIDADAGEKQSLFTIYDLLLGKYYLFDIDFFNLKSGDGNATLINNLKDNVAIWYTGLRNVALIGSALIIIYIAIRLAIAITSGEAAETAKYNKMITSWLIGIVLIFIVYFLAIILIYANTFIVDFLKNIITASGTDGSMEARILTNTVSDIAAQKGINKLLFVVLYWVLVYYQLKFFIVYLERMLEVYFLMIVSPLVCMLYPIDFVGDGRSQSFKKWFKTLTEKIMLQSIQLGVFVIFMITANEIATEAPLVAILFFSALSNGEKIVKKLFGFGGKNIKDVHLKKIRPH